MALGFYGPLRAFWVLANHAKDLEEGLRDERHADGLGMCRLATNHLYVDIIAREDLDKHK